MKSVVKKLFENIKAGCRASLIVHEDPFWKVLSLLVIGGVFVTGVILDNYNIGIFAVDLLLAYNVWYFLGSVKERGLFFVINFAVFLFLISRPTISLIRGNEWWYFKESSVWMAVFSLLLVLFFLNIGFCHGEALVKLCRQVFNRKKREISTKRETSTKWKRREFRFDKGLMKKICIVLFLVGFGACMVQEVPKFLYTMTHDYVELYSDYVDVTPFFIRIFATMMPYFLCGYLICLPEKRRAFVPLACYVLTGVPQFLAGSRNDMMVKLMFVFIYYCLRDMVAVGKAVWLGKIERILIVVLIPVLIVALGLLNFAREGSSIKKNDGNVIVNFFYLQGTSFDTLCEGFDYEEELKSSEYVTSYTFGNFIDYVTHGTASQILFGAEDLGSGNSYKMATESNSLAHHLSFLVLKKNYLYGHGRGSSFILETYMDLGFLGVALYTVLLGIGLRLAPRLIRKNWFAGLVTLIALTNIFLVPRWAAMGMMEFLITLQFWIAVVMMVFFYVAAYKLRARRLGNAG